MPQKIPVFNTNENTPLTGVFRSNISVQTPASENKVVAGDAKTKSVDQPAPVIDTTTTAVIDESGQKIINQIKTNEKSEFWQNVSNWISDTYKKSEPIIDSIGTGLGVAAGIGGIPQLAATVIGSAVGTDLSIAKEKKSPGITANIARTIGAGYRSVSEFITAQGKNIFTGYTNAFSIPTSVSKYNLYELVDDLSGFGVVDASIMQDLGFTNEPLNRIEIGINTLKMWGDNQGIADMNAKNELVKKSWEEQKKARPDNLELPILEPVREVWEKYFNTGKPNFFGLGEKLGLPILDKVNVFGRYAYWLDEKNKELNERYIKPVDTGNFALDYGLTTLGSTVGIVAGLSVPSSLMAKLGQGILKTEMAQSSLLAAKVGEKALPVVMAATSAGAMNIMSAENVYNQSRYSDIKNLLPAEQYKIRQDAEYNKLVEQWRGNDKNLVPSEDETRLLQNEADKQLQAKLFEEQTPETKKGIEEKAMSGYHTTIELTSASVVIMPIVQRSFLTGATGTNRILKSPTQYDWRSSLTKGGPAMYAMMNLYGMAEEAGLKATKGENYSLGNAMDYALSLKGFESGMSGYFIGAGSHAMGARSTFAARKERYLAQQETLKDQNKISDPENDVARNAVEVNETIQDNMDNLKKAKILSDIGDTEGEKLNSGRVLRTQALTSFLMGTKDNLVENYKKVSGDDRFTDASRAAAEKAIVDINKMEKIFLDSKKHLNSTDIYYNRTDDMSLNDIRDQKQIKLEDNLGAFAKELNDLIVKKRITMGGMGIGTFLDILGNPELMNQTYYEVGTSPDMPKVPFKKTGNQIHDSLSKTMQKKVKEITDLRYQIEKLDFGIDNNNTRHEELTSKETQGSIWQMNRLYTKLAEFEVNTKKDNSDFNRYESKEYEDLLDAELKKRDKHINNNYKDAIKTDFTENKKRYFEQKRNEEKETAFQAKQKADRENGRDADVVDEEIKKGSPENNVDLNAGKPEEAKVAEKKPTEQTPVQVLALKEAAGKIQSVVQGSEFIAKPPVIKVESFIGSEKDWLNRAIKILSDFEDKSYSEWGKTSAFPATSTIRDLLSQSKKIPQNIKDSLSDQFNNIKSGKSTENKPIVSGKNYIVDDSETGLFEGKANEYVADENDELYPDPKMISDDLLPEQKTILADNVSTMLNVLKSTNPNPTFKDLIKDYIKITSLNEADEAYDALYKGWLYSGQPTGNIDYKGIYDQLFTDKYSVFHNFNAIVNYLPGIETPKEIEKSITKQEVVDEKENIKQNGGQIKFDAEGNEYIDVPEEEWTSVKEGTTVISEEALNAGKATVAHYVAFKSVEVNEPIEGKTRMFNQKHYLLDVNDFYVDPYYPDMKKLNFPGLYQAGTILHASVHPDVNDVPIYAYDENGRPLPSLMPFSEHVNVENQKRKFAGKKPLTEQEIINRMPMAIFDADGDIVASIPNVYSIQGHHTDRNYQEAKQNTIDIRNAIIKHRKIDLVVSHKYVGHINDLKLPFNELKLVKDVDPDSQIAITKPEGIYFGTDKPQIKNDQIVNIDIILRAKMGSAIDFRKVGTLPDGRTQYWGFLSVKHDNINQSTINTIKWAIDTYLNKGDESHPDSSKFKNIISEIIKKTNNQINMNSEDDILDLSRYIKLFLFTSDSDAGGGSHQQKVRNVISTIQNGISGNIEYPYIFTQDGKIIIGKAKKRISDPKVTEKLTRDRLKDSGLTEKQIDEKIKDELFADELANAKANPYISSDSANFMDQLMLHLPLLSTNTSQDGLDFVGKIPIINQNGIVEDGYTDYSDYSRNVLRTNYDARKLTITYKGVEYTQNVSLIHPTIELKLVEKGVVTTDDLIKTVISGEVSKDNIINVAEKIVSDKPLTTAETVISINASEEIKKIIEKNIPQLTKEQLNAKINKKLEQFKDTGIAPFKKDDGLMSDPRKMTDEEIKVIIEGSQVIKGLPSIYQRQITQYIFTNFAKIIVAAEGKSLNLGEIDKIVKQIFDNTIRTRIEHDREEYNTFKSIYESSDNPEVDYPNMPELLQSYKKNLELIDLVDKNYLKFHDTALEKILKSMNVINIDPIENDLEDYNPDKDKDQEILEESTEKHHEFTKTSIEINPRDSATARLRMLFWGIENLNNNGEVITGFLGLPTYPGFDDIFDEASVLLAEGESNYVTVKAKLLEFAQSHPWMKTLINELETNISSQNEFVTVLNKHALRMKFLRINTDKNGKNTFKIWDTNSNAITRSLISKWKTNIKSTNLVISNDDGKFVFNNDEINNIIEEYNNIKGTNTVKPLPVGYLRLLKDGIDKYLKATNLENELFKNVVPKNGIVVRLPKDSADKVVSELNGEKSSFKEYGLSYSVQSRGNNEFLIKPYTQTPTDFNTVLNWFKRFGITLSPNTIADIKNNGFRYNSITKIPWEKQWIGDDGKNSKSLLGGLVGTLKRIQVAMNADNTNNVYDEELIDPKGFSLLSQSIIKALAHMESKYTNDKVVSSLYSNHKSIYGFTATKYITDQARLLKLDPVVGGIYDDLLSKAYNQKSYLLDLLANDPKNRELFEVIHLDPTAFTEANKTLYADHELKKLSKTDHEGVKIGNFQSMGQGNVKSSRMKYPGIDFRFATMFSPTMSNKDTVILFKLPVVNITKNTLDVYDNVLEFAYEQLVVPEMSRIISFKQKIDDRQYNEGAKMIFALPGLNNIKVFNSDGKPMLFLDMLEVFDQAGLEKEIVQYNDQWLSMKEILLNYVDEYIQNEVNNKINDWKKSKFIKIDNTTDKITDYTFFDKSYMQKRLSNDVDQRVRIAALDYTLNSLIVNNNLFMSIIGDPALYFKQEKLTKKIEEREGRNYIQTALDTAINTGKRLASMIAPKNKIAGSDIKGNEYLEIISHDAIRMSKNIKYLTMVNDGKEITDAEIEHFKTTGQLPVNTEGKELFPKSKAFFTLESTNATEYKTQNEALHILRQQGKLSNTATIMPKDDVKKAREKYMNDEPRENFTDAEWEIVSTINQVEKPVHVSQASKKDRQKMTYIKTAAITLTPDLTAGLELDHVRQIMERHEENDPKGRTLRLTHDSGVKVGNIEGLNLYDSNGNITEEAINISDKDLSKNTMVLNRSGFGIQQVSPIKSNNRKSDVVSKGVQITRLLFGNGVMKFNDFSYNGNDHVSGMEMQKMFTNNFIDLHKTLKNNLYDELGININTGTSYNKMKTLEKIESILKSRASIMGYSRQSLKALQINVEKENFDIPLWLSGTEKRYQGLLASIITNTVAKPKFPGYLYISGSQTGFKIQQGYKGISKSKIVFTNAFDGELKPNQILVPCKLRIDGKIINLLKNFSKRVPVDNGEFMNIIDYDKIDESLLQDIITFHTPSAKHSSMELTEIAGFLPARSGDLMIVSQDRVEIMSEDYDIDTSTGYHRFTTHEDGKLIPLEKSKIFNVEGKTPIEVIDDIILNNYDKLNDYKKAYHQYKAKTDILQKQADTAKYELGFMYGMEYTRETENYKRLLEQLISTNDDHSSYLQDIKDIYKEIRKFQEMKVQIYLNNIINIQAATMKHPEVKKLSSKRLSVDKATEDAVFISKLNPPDNHLFTMLSETYQRKKLMDGAVGNNATALFSLDLSAYSLMTQSKDNNKPIRLMKQIMEDDGEGNFYPRWTEFTIRFGEQVSDGELGNVKTLDGERTVAEVIAEEQTASVDDEKEQLLYRLGLNDYTLMVHRVLNFNRFDKGDAVKDSNGNDIKVGISYLFNSQPVIKDYIERMEIENRHNADYNPNKKENIIKEILSEYGFMDKNSVPNKDWEMTNKNMVEQIKNNGQDKEFQAAVLLKWLELEAYGPEITGLETSLNVDSKGVGKNILESQEKTEYIKRLIPRDKIPEGANLSSGVKFINGAGDLFGDYAVVFTESEKNDNLKEGYITISIDKNSIGQNQYMMIKPTTMAGASAIYSLVAANELWSDFFPYKEPEVRKLFIEAKRIFGSDVMGVKKLIELKQSVIDSMKKYLYTDSEAINIFGLNPQEERQRLFIDKYELKKGKNGIEKVLVHESLPTYLNRLTNNPQKEFLRVIKNPVIARFDYKTDATGYSTIEFNNEPADSFDEEALYNFVNDLLEIKTDLPDFNGKSYNSHDLVQDLVLNAVLGNPNQGATGYIKYIDVNYLVAIGVGDINRNENGIFSKKKGRNILGISDSEISTFSFQNTQHFPEKVRAKLTEEMMKDKTRFRAIDFINPLQLNTLMSFDYDENSELFYSIYNKNIRKGENKFQLYALDKTIGHYVRIPIFGRTGINEFMAGYNNYPSIINHTGLQYPRFGAAPSEPIPVPIETGKFDVLSSDPVKILTSVSESDTPIGKVAKILLPILPSGLKISVGDYFDRGNFDFKTNTVMLQKKFLDSLNPESEIARTIVKEFVHAVTVAELKKYTDTIKADINGIKNFTVREDAPNHVKRLFAIFNEVQKNLNKNNALAEVVRKRSVKEGLTEREYNVTYAGIDIFEFVERIMTTPELQVELNKINFKNSDSTLWDKFSEWGAAVINEATEKLGMKIKPENVTAETLSTIFQMFEDKMPKTIDNELQAKKAILKSEELLVKLASRNIDPLGLGVPSKMDSDLNKALHDEDYDPLGFNNIPYKDIEISRNPDELSNDPNKIAIFDKISTGIGNMLKDKIITFKC